MGEAPTRNEAGRSPAPQRQVSADVAAEVTRAGGLSYTWWLGDRPPEVGWMLPTYFVAYVDEIVLEES